MAIDLNSENLVSVGRAAELFPSVNGKKPARETVLKWVRKGVRGVKLESELLAGRYVTSAEAVGRFIENVRATNNVSAS